ncbi:MAG: PilZ domain-containing protein [Myxococcota bacterium]|nr:PilZ domain-containing protein [Myxococcota bacterium]
MQESAQVLLLDDGELTEVATLLDQMGIGYVRPETSEMAEASLPPLELLIATAPHAGLVQRGSPAGARPGRPLRIIATDDKSDSLHEKLHELGFHLKVKLPGHSEIWDLLIRRALYPGTERRSEERVAVGACVSLALESNARGRTSARLMDISNRGCRILTPYRMTLGRNLSVILPSQVSGGLSLRLDGEVVRVAKATHSDGHFAGILWDAHMSDFLRIRLSSLLNEWSLGPPEEMTAAPELDMPILPSHSSESLDGLVLDDETDPPIAVPRAVGGTASTRDFIQGEERRRESRRPYLKPVPSHRCGRGKVLMARNLSALGMKIEPMPHLDLGQQIELVLHGPGLIEPLRLSAQVARDDGTEGLVLAFQAMSPDQVHSVNQLVGGLPLVESLESDPKRVQGAILAELVDEGPALR